MHSRILLLSISSQATLAFPISFSPQPREARAFPSPLEPSKATTIHHPLSPKPKTTSGRKQKEARSTEEGRKQGRKGRPRSLDVTSGGIEPSAANTWPEAPPLPVTLNPALNPTKQDCYSFVFMGIRTVMFINQAEAGGARNVPAELRLPEARLNGMILRWAFIDKVRSGFGALALAWATIVLLGGFSTLLKQQDFWFVTIISFMEATRLSSSAVYPEDHFIINAPEVVAAITERNEAMERGRWRRHGDTLELAQGMNQTPPRRGIRGMIMGFALVLFAAGITSVILAVLRLRKQDFVDPMYEGSSDHKSIKVSLNLFYGLVLAQGVCSFLAHMMLTPDIQQALKLSRTYQLDASGPQIIKRYMLDTYMKCFRGSVREAMNMDLVAFAKEMARSESVEDRLIGVRTLDRILRVEKYRGLALMRLRASIETVGNVVNMLGLKTKTPEEENTRGHAANVVLELSPDLLVECYPAMLQQISSLLVVKTTTMARGNAQHSISVSMELTWFGVQILNKIMDNPENCKQVKDADDQVISSIVDLTTCSSDNSSISSSAVAEEIIVVAVQVLHKLACITGEAGRVLRSKISENVHVLRNSRMILEHPKSQPKLLVEAMGILACLALDETGREDIGSSPRIIRRLLSFLVAGAPENVENASDRIKVAEAAAEALVMLAIDSESNRSRILEEMKPENMQQLVQMLSEDSGELKTMVAKLLWSLRANSKAEHTSLVKEIDSALPELLKAIKLEVEKLEAPVSAGNHHTHNLEESRTKQDKLLESFVGLSVQICTFIQAKDFDDALRSANLPVDLFVQKLKKILDLYKSPTTEFPGIRRATVELIIWMMRNSISDTQVFLGYAVDKAMTEVAETAARLERFKLFYCGVGVAKHSESISSLVRSALGSTCYPRQNGRWK